MVTVQTEHLDDHTARLTVEVEAERIEKAMHQVARKLAKKTRIPGFRPGKAPFKVVVRMLGREYVFSEALDSIIDDIYKEALEAAEIEPYAPGELEEIDEENLRLVFHVAKQPEVELGDYRSIRVEYEEPEVRDEAVERMLQAFRASFAETEDVGRPAEMGDRVLLDHLEIIAYEDTPEAEGAETAEENDESAQQEEHQEESKGPRVLLHEHNLIIDIDNNSEDVFLPGFSEKFIGVKAGEVLEFEMTVPEDFEDEELAGRRVLVNARVDRVQSRTLPELDEEFIKRASNGDFETLDELRADIRRHLEEEARKKAEAEALQQALDQLIEGATLRYPPQMVESVIDEYLEEIEGETEDRYGLDLENYLKVVGKSEEELREQYREAATRQVESALVLSEFGRAEQLQVSDTAIDKHVEELLSQLLPEGKTPELREGLRTLLHTPESRQNIATSLLEERITRHLLAIVKGEEPPVGGVQEEAEAEAEAQEQLAAAEDAESVAQAAEAENAEATETPQAENAENAAENE